MTNEASAQSPKVSIVVPEYNKASLPGNKAQITVSIVVPVYNVADYLPKCLDSIAAQTFNRWEAVLVDDGSTDASGEICDRYAQSDSRFRVVHQPNGGVSMARNTGIDKARGTWLAFIDADDWVEPDYLERLLSDAVDVDMVIGGWIGVSGPLAPARRFVERSEIPTLITSWEINLGNVWGKLFSTDVFKGHNISFARDVRWAEDVMVVNEYLTHAKRVAMASVTGYHYTDRPGSGVKHYHPLRCEYAGFEASKRVRSLLEETFPGHRIKFSPEAYLLRTINASMYDYALRDDRRERLRFLRSLDFKRRWVKVRRGPAREMLFSILVRTRMWRLLDRLMH